MSIIEIAIEPKSKADQEKLSVSLANLAAEDPSFEVKTDRESGQTVLGGTSEAHLDAKIDTLKRSGIGTRVGAPQVAFRECIGRRVEHSYTYKRQTGKTGQFAAVTLLVEPNGPGKGNKFESEITDDVVPSKYIAGVEAGVGSVMSSGVVAGFPVMDIKVRIINGKYHDADSSAQAFEIAARTCFREALQKADAILFEPVMKVEVVTPNDCASAILRDLTLRRGQLGERHSRESAWVVDAMVPLMNMFGYSNALREISGGRGSFTMRFDHYAPAYPNDDDPPFGPAVGMRA